MDLKSDQICAVDTFKFLNTCWSLAFFRLSECGKVDLWFDDDYIVHVD